MANIKPLLVLLLSLTCISCSYAKCSLIAPHGEPLLVFIYITPGDGPTLTVMRVYYGGLLELEPAGLLRQCASTDSASVATINNLLHSQEFERFLERERSLLAESEALDVRVDIKGTRLVKGERATALEPVATEVERIFKKAFGRSFHVPLWKWGAAASSAAAETRR